MQSQFTINEQRFGSRCFNEFIYIEILKVRHNGLANNRHRDSEHGYLINPLNLLEI